VSNRGGEAVAHESLTACQVDVIHPQPQPFEQSQSRAGKQARHQADETVDLRQEPADLGRGRHHGKATRLAGTDETLDVGYFEIEDPLMEERDRVQGLVRGRCCDAAFEREVAQERGNLPGAHRAGMTLAVEQDLAPDPVDVGLLGPQAHVPNAGLGANPLEQARTPRARRRQPRADAAGSRGIRLAARRRRRRMRGS
jgi:hypothetical protein